MKEMVVSNSKKSSHAKCPAIAQRNLDRSRGPFLLERTHTALPTRFSAEQTWQPLNPLLPRFWSRLWRP